MRSARLAVRQKRRRRTTKILFWAVLFSALPILSYFLWQWMMEASLFRVERLVVRGNHWIGGDVVKARLREVLRQNLFQLDLASLQERLRSLSWVDQVVLRRELPETLAVRIFEKTPLAVGLHKGQRYLVDWDGEVIDAYEEPYRLAYPSLFVIESAGQIHHRDAYRIGAKIIHNMQATSPALAEEMTRLTVHSPARVDLHLQGVDWLLCVRGEYPIANLIAYHLLKERIHTEYQGLEAVDLRWAGQIVLIE